MPSYAKQYIGKTGLSVCSNEYDALRYCIRTVHESIVEFLAVSSSSISLALSELGLYPAFRSSDMMTRECSRADPTRPDPTRPDPPAHGPNPTRPRMDPTRVQLRSAYSSAYPCNVEVESVLEVFRLSDYHQVEAPASAEIGDDDGVHGPWRQKCFPRGLQSLQQYTSSRDQ